MIVTSDDIALMRADQDGLLPDLCRVRLPGEWSGPVGSAVWSDGATVECGGERCDGYVPCRIVDDEAVHTMSQSGGQDVTVRRFTITLPWRVRVPLIGLVLEVVPYST